MSYLRLQPGTTYIINAFAVLRNRDHKHSFSNFRRRIYFSLDQKGSLIE